MTRPSATLLRALEQVKPHGHLCSIYEDEEEHYAVSVPFIRLGLERNERCVYIADATNLDTVRQALRDGGVDVDGQVEAGALVLATKDETYLRHGSFRPEWMFTFWQEAAEEAVAAGYAALRATGETEWVTRGGPGLEHWMDYECRLTHTLARCRAFALCQYDRRVFPPDLVKAVIRTHPVVIHRDTVCDNFYFVPPDELLGREAPDREVERLLLDIRTRVQLDQELRQANADLERRVADRTRELREREQWLALAQRAAGLCIAEWDGAGRLVRCSEGFPELYGLTEAPTRQEWLARMHPEDRTRVEQELAALAAANGSAWETELRAGARWIAVRAVLGVADAGVLDRLLVTSVDVTARKEQEEEQLAAQKLHSAGLLAAGVAHDFNNVLTGILGHATFLRRKAPPAFQLGLDAIAQCATRASELTRQLLDYAGDGPQQLSDLDLAELLGEVEPLLRLGVPPEVALRTTVEPGLPRVRADARQLKQVLVNLVTNGAEAVGPGRPGRVEVRLRAGGAGVEVEVADDGCGMEAEVLAHAFEPFFTTKFHGRGLGLAAVAGIARGHGGRASATSSPGQGSVVRVSFPAS